MIWETFCLSKSLGVSPHFLRYEVPIWEFQLYDHAHRVSEGQVCRRRIDLDRMISAGVRLTRPQ